MLLLAAMALGAGLGLRDPSPPDEPRFVLAAQTMVESGQWAIPYRGIEPYAHKPAPFMWLQALAYTVVGNWRIAFLLPSLLAALGTLWLTTDLATRLWDRRAGLHAGLALLACLQFGLQAKRGQIDMVLVFWTTLSLWALSRHLLRGPDWRALALGGLAAGIGTVTKGVGFLPLLILLPWWLARRRGMQLPMDGYRDRRWWWLPVGFLVGVGVWLVPMLWTVARSTDPALHAYAAEILLKQTGTRYANAWHHVKPAWYYLQVIATLWLPGALLLPWLAPQWWRRIRVGDARVFLLVGWAVLVLLFFTASPGKREVYLFPALPALCIAAASLLPGLLERAWVRRVLLGYVVALSSAALLLAVGGLGGTGWLDGVATERALDSATVRSVLLWAGALGLGGLALAVWGRTARAGWVAVAFNLLLWTVYGLGLAPALDASSSAREMMQQVRVQVGPQATVGLVGWREQHLLQATGPVTEFGFSRDERLQWRDGVAWLAQDPSARWLFALKDAAGACADPAGFIDLGRSSRRDWVLIPGDAYVTGCVPPLPADLHVSAAAAPD
ncbi:hypothetical protein TI01_0598 [Lysobacter sp. A03]|nr:hypothetical protein TI01_0598 [Lysobacter sp. A03]